jgi:hypothetical protein
MEKIMKNTNVLAAKMAGAGALALLLATSAFADNRPQDGTWRGRTDQRSDRRDGGSRTGRRDDANRGGSYDQGRGNSSRQYRENERVSMQGHISRYAHERGGYRVWIDNGPYGVWVPEARWRNDWRVGININLGGIFRGGTIYSDVYDAPYGNGVYDRNGYRASYVTGYVDRVDYRSGLALLRDARNGRMITLDMRPVDGRSRLDSRDLRRGDRVTVSGSWLRNGYFAAARIDSVDSRRY